MNDLLFACILISIVYDRVSSVLNRDVKQFGKKYMFDDNEETCWNSDQVDLYPYLLAGMKWTKKTTVRLN